MNPIPLYFQVEQIIRSKIFTGEYGPGEPIPTQKELSKDFKVSVITIRQAVLNLVSEGLLSRIQGKGTFVTKKLTRLQAQHFDGNIHNLISDALRAQEVRVLDIVKSKVARNITEVLKLEEGSEVIRVRRIRISEKVPNSYIMNYLPVEIGEEISKDELCKHPMLQILMDKLKIPLRGGHQSIEAIVADYDIASALGVSICSPILYIQTQIFSRQERPVEYVQVFMRPDRYKLFVNLSVKKGPGKEIQVSIQE